MENNGNHILVCINGHPKTMTLLRNGLRRAREIGCTWSVLYVVTPAHYEQSEEYNAIILRFLTIAEHMGATAERIEATDVMTGIDFYVRGSIGTPRHVTHIILGQTEKEGLLGEFLPSTPEKIFRRLRDKVEIQLIPMTGETYGKNWFFLLTFGHVRIREIIYSILAVGCAWMVVELLKITMPAALFRINGHNVSIIFLIACAFCAGRFGLLPGLIAAMCCFLLINTVYLTPLMVMSFENPTDVVNLVLFLLAAVVLASFSSYTRSHAEAARRKEKRTETLFRLSRIASKASGRKDLLYHLHQELSHLLEMDVVYFLPATLNPDKIEPAYPKDTTLNEASTKALVACWEEIRTTGAGTTRIRNAEWRFEPMVTAQGEIGVLGVRLKSTKGLDVSFGRLLTALAEQSASIFERMEMTQQMHETRISEEREKLRSLLLSSVSHDLKTPLASIIGSLSVYHSMFDRISNEQKLTLTQTALDEAQRLDSFITNILDMTRIESGAIRFKKEWCDPEEILHGVGKRLRLRLRDHTLNISPCSERIEVEADGTMLGQVLQNVIDNAGKYAPPKTRIDVEAIAEDQGFRISIHDRGQGIPESQRQMIFNKYTRLNKTDSQVAGTGLGLAICKAIMEAMGGNISITNHVDGGAVFTISLPRWRITQTGEAAA